MSEAGYIIDTKLPVNQDFKLLKEEALAYIQQYTGNDWTNFNASDPGVTILDQVCYALTELGYCNDFPVKDILTLPNGELQLNDQFYLPEDILTTSPVTSTDYIKYLVDGVGGVKNAVIIPVSGNDATTCDIYQVYLLIDKAVTSASEMEDICKAAFFYLNKCRNIGEIFHIPVPLEEAPHFITGKIEIENETGLDSVLTLIDAAIRNYIFPEAIQAGYQQLKKDGFDIDEIFNGPILQNGWITTGNLGEKKDQLNTVELTGLIAGVPGVKSVSEISFNNPFTSITRIASHQKGKLVIDLAKSIAKGLKIMCRGKELTNAIQFKPSTAIANAQSGDNNIQLGAAIRVQTEVPTGKYRDINSYYSIQNTFPEVFAVGADATTSNASDFQIAQSRQLKGYLTLIDQVLANQFSQLANIGRLFSFKNVLTGAPSDRDEFYAVEDNFEKIHPEYPVPYLTFSPTYFYQSLYDIPHIRPLLKGNDTFNFSRELESNKELEQKSWNKYKEDPYNPYIRGLMEFMGEEKDSLVRRNNILDHLLARHGESPMMINMFIDGSVYTGDKMKDMVIFKSLYLQNIGLLSYFRQKGYNYKGANKISDAIKRVPPNFEQLIFGGDTKDFISNAARIDRTERLKKQDFINYSAIELKLCMLFGLKVQYRDFIANNFKNAAKSEDIKLALWMILERKGMIFIENDLLFQHSRFDIVITDDPQSGWHRQLGGSLSYEESKAVAQILLNNTTHEFNHQFEEGTLNIRDSKYKLGDTKIYGQENKCYQWVPQTDYFFTVRVRYNDKISFESNPVLNNRVEIIFPAFVPPFDTRAFKDRLSLFLQNLLPVQISFGCHFIEAISLELLIKAFADWHNSLIHSNDTKSEIEINQSAGVLAKLLNEINSGKK